MVDHLRDGFGVDPVCRVLDLSPFTYFTRKLSPGATYPPRPSAARDRRTPTLRPFTGVGTVAPTPGTQHSWPQATSSCTMVVIRRRMAEERR